MSNVATFVLRDERDRQFAIRAVERCPLGKAVVIGPPKRSVEQNRRLHSQLNAIIEAKTEIAGREWDITSWREIMMILYIAAKEEEETGTMVDLGGRLAVIGRRRTSDLNTTEFAEFMEFVTSWIDERQIPWEELGPAL